MDDSRKLDRTWLCSIVFSDIVNYSSQSVDVQMKWKQFFNDVLTEALKAVPADDRVVLDTGDGAAICFLGDPETALLSTLSMRSAFVTAAAQDPGNPGIRLGINLGPVKLVRDINANLNALGDGINVAQRIMSFAGPNQVLVSRSFFEVVSRLSEDYNRLFRYDGVRQDKHVREHTVYELSPAASERASAPAAVAPDAPAHSASEGSTRRQTVRGLWLGSAAGFVAVVLIAFYALRAKPQPVPGHVQEPPPAAAIPSPAANAPPVAAPAQHPAPASPKAPAVTHETAPAAAAAPLTGQKTPAPAVAVLPNSPGDIGGRWQADVKYSWGDTHTEFFDFKIDGNEVLGTASYLRAGRAILDGKLEGNKLTFTTKSQTMLGDKTYEEKHHYRGRVSGATIEFILQTDSGYDSRPPEMFTARRVAPGSAQ